MGKIKKEINMTIEQMMRNLHAMAENTAPPKASTKSKK